MDREDVRKDYANCLAGNVARFVGDVKGRQIEPRFAGEYIDNVIGSVNSSFPRVIHTYFSQWMDSLKLQLIPVPAPTNQFSIQPPDGLR